MKNASALGLIGVLVMVVGCSPLLSPAPNWPTDSVVEGSITDELRDELPPLPQSSTQQNPTSVSNEGPLPNLYSSILTPPAGESAISANNGQTGEPDEVNQMGTSPSPTSTMAPIVTATQVATATRVPTRVSTSTPNSGTSTGFSTPTPMPTFTPIPTATATPTPRPPVQAVPGLLNFIFDDPPPNSGGQTRVRMVLATAETGLSGFDIELTIENNARVEIADVELPGFGLASVSPLPSDSVEIRAVDLKELVSPGAGQITLATIILEGKSQGTTPVEVIVNALDDDLGQPIEADVPEVTITVR